MSSNSYDLVPYETFPFVETHPDRLYTLARLHGVKSAKPEAARILELGCATGGNLIPMALRYTQSEFLGIDLSEKQIELANEASTFLNLKNLKFKVEDILSIDESFGQFDYILCHGVFSWVPKEVQEKIFRICRERLSPNGVAFISFNTYPGWLSRRMARDFMKFHAQFFDSPQSKVSEAKSFFESMVNFSKPQQNYYAAALSNEWAQIRDKSDEYLLHEYLEDNNEPLYFSEFMERAKKHGLSYLRDARFGLSVKSLPADIQRVLLGMKADRVAYEQYLDFYLNRVFRRALVVKNENQVSDQIDLGELSQLYLGAKLNRIGQNTFQHYRFGTSSVRLNSTADRLCRLSEIAPEVLSVSELEQGLSIEEQLSFREDISDLFSQGLVEVFSNPPVFVNALSSQPMVNDWVRFQASRTNRVTNQRHELVSLNEPLREIILKLDGKKGLEELRSQVSLEAQTNFDQSLSELRRQALLVG